MSKGPFLRKYGVETTLNFDLFQIDGVDFRVDAVHAAGDTKIMKDEGAEANTTNGFTDEGQGYSIVLTATEMQAARIKVYIVDSATKVWLDTSITIETYGNASAMHAFDLDTANVTLAAATHTGAVIPTVSTLTGHTAQTGDSFARIGAAGAGLTDLGGMSTAMKAEVNAEADTALTDYDPPTKAELDSGLAGLNDPTAAVIADAVWDETMTAHATADSAAVHLKDTLADTNELQGDDVPGLIATAQADLDILTGTDGVTLATAQGNYAPAKAGDNMGTVSSVTGNVDGSVGSVTGAVGSVTAEVTADVTKISGSATAADNLEAHALESLPVTFTGGTTTTAVLGNVDGAAASSTDDVYNGRILIFNVGTLNHQVAEITDYVGSTKTATISAVTTAVTSSHTARME